MNSTERKAHNSELLIKSDEKEAPDFEEETQCVPDINTDAAANIITKAKKSRKKVFTNDIGSSKKLRTEPTIDQSQLLAENLDLIEGCALLQQENRDLKGQRSQLLEKLNKVQTLRSPPDVASQHQVFTNEKGNHYFKLSFKRRATINKFQGATLLDLRVYNPASNPTFPSKQGIALPPDQFEVLIDICKNGQLQKEIDRIGQH